MCRSALTAKAKTQNGHRPTLASSYVISVPPIIEIMVFIFHLSGKQQFLLLYNRSLKMDRWKMKEIKQMELGGNKNAEIYY